ncbi:hypothetical protein A8F66_02555 [Burkholderia cenocepacia]|nr:hypothetical protein A8F32_23675 [Burkholderia cenocepacia]ONI93651.1 hypothetical protein A8F53_25025 [Burkholderia cenocepacia]ONJ09914.1 hypothetical protein A8F33_06030 [Burkholderia cenocepacia]ONJ28709.1 hypothetical protein A8F38_20745 [Burkholderia cenocepacia]ONY71878.1 hypothetical protein A8F35_19120 [Burkholderia cenocepacia]
MDELLGLDDEAFILAAYRTVLGREADQEGHEYYLRRIRNGIGKLHILGQLRNSKEARARSIDLSGLDRAIRATKLKRIFSFTAPWTRHRNDQDRKLNELENSLHALARVAASTNEQVSSLHASLIRLPHTLGGHHQPVMRGPASADTPLISVITPLYKTSVYYLERLATSLWAVRDSIEWVVVNDSPGVPHVESFVDRMQSCFPNIKYVRHDVNQGIFTSYTSGINAATTPYVAILDHDDEVDLAPIVAHLNTAGEHHDLIYTDEVRFGQEVNVHFAKPTFDPLSSMHYFYMHHITLFRTSICKGLIEKEPDAVKKYRSCFDIWLALGYIRHFGSRPISSKYMPYPSYGWRVHDDSTAKSLGQKPLADGERIEIAKSLYRELDPLANIELDDEARYLVRYRYPTGSAQDRKQLAKLICSYFDVYTHRMSAISEHQMGRGDHPLLAALSSVPLAYLDDFIAGKCLVVPRQKLPRDSRIHDSVSRHLDNVPVLEMIDDRLSPADFAKLTAQSIGILSSRRAPKMNKSRMASHLLVV